MVRWEGDKRQRACSPVTAPAMSVPPCTCLYPGACSYTLALTLCLFVPLHSFITHTLLSYLLTLIYTVPGAHLYPQTPLIPCCWCCHCWCCTCCHHWCCHYCAGAVCACSHSFAPVVVTPIVVALVVLVVTVPVLYESDIRWIFTINSLDWLVNITLAKL